MSLPQICTSGRPFGLIEVRVVAEDGALVTPASGGGAVGNVWIRGATVFRGYRNSAKGPADGFDASGFFDTGDMAVVDRHGYLTVVDRAKDMVLTGGENVFSTEVENVLSSHGAVAHAAVFGLPHPVLGETVTAAVVLREGAAASARELTQHCAGRLAGYKVPYRVLFFEAFPMTASGKARARSVFSSASLPSDASSLVWVMIARLKMVATTPRPP